MEAWPDARISTSWSWRRLPVWTHAAKRKRLFSVHNKTFRNAAPQNMSAIKEMISSRPSLPQTTFSPFGSQGSVWRFVFVSAAPLTSVTVTPCSELHAPHMDHILLTDLLHTIATQHVRKIGFWNLVVNRHGWKMYSKQFSKTWALLVSRSYNEPGLIQADWF